MTTDASPAAKALRYAEDTLGVHSVYETALEARKTLDEVLNEMATCRDKKRSIEGKIQDRQFEVMEEEHSKHSGMSAAAMDKHLKLAYHNDPYLQEQRAELAKCIDDLDGLELDRTMAETDIKIATARLHELGGYLEFLAAIKNQATSS